MRVYESFAGKAVLGAIVGAIVIAGGCGKKDSGSKPDAGKKSEAASLPRGQETSLLPLAMGNQWVYTAEIVGQGGSRIGTTRSTLTLKVVKVTPTKSGVKARIQILNDRGDKPEFQNWFVNNKGIYQLTAGRKETGFVPPQPAILFPPDPSKKFTWSGTGFRPYGGIGPVTVKSDIRALQEVDTELGSMGAYPVHSVSEYTVDKKKVETESTVWWSPKVGFVRYLQVVRTPDAAIRQILRLKSYSLK